MGEMQLAMVIGSLRRDSINRRLAHAIARLAPRHVSFRSVEIGDLPLYNQDYDSNPAPEVVRLKREIASAQGVIFVTPEYNRGLPGVLKNALDHGSRPYGRGVWAGKPAGIMGASTSHTGTAAAQQQLRAILGNLDMPTLGQPELFFHVQDGTFDRSGDFADGIVRGLVSTWLERYLSWVKLHLL